MFAGSGKELTGSRGPPRMTIQELQRLIVVVRGASSRLKRLSSVIERD